MSETVEIIKAATELLKPIWWPCTVFASIFMMRHELRSVVKRISKLRFGLKDASADIDLAPELIKAGEAMPLDEDKARRLRLETHAEIKATVTAGFSLIDQEEQKKQAIALRTSIGNDLEIVESLLQIAGVFSREAIKESWEIVEKRVIETARLFGMRRTEDGASELSKATRFLALDVLRNQNLLVGVYALAAAWQKVEKNQGADVDVEETRAFIRYCRAILTDLGSKLDALIKPQGPASS